MEDFENLLLQLKEPEVLQPKIALAPDFFNKDENLAEVTGLEHSRAKDLERKLLKFSTFSQKMGVCLYLSQFGCFPAAEERLLYFQSIANLEAIEASIRFSEELVNKPKLRKDKKHLLSYFAFEKRKVKLRKVKQKVFRRGYQDHGNLPDFNHLRRKEANQAAMLDLRSLDSQEVREFIYQNLPEELFEGFVLDLSETYIYLQEEEMILKRLKEILRRF